MAEFRDLSVNQENLNEREIDAAVPDDFPNEILFDAFQNWNQIMLEDMGDRRIQNESNLLILSIELKDVIIFLLEMQLKLVDIKQKRVRNNLKLIADNLKNLISKFQNIPTLNENQEEQKKVQGSLNSLTTSSQQLEDLAGHFPNSTVDEGNFMDEMRKDFANYQEAYKKCVLPIERFLQNAEMKKISDVPRESQEELCILFSVLEENLDYYNEILTSSKKEFEHFEIIFETDMASSSNDSDKRIDDFITAIKKAELAYMNLKPLLFEVVNLVCALGRSV